MDFAGRVIAWQRQHGRHHLPWQKTRNPYWIWLSEIMLQQTQVAAVIPYFERFVARFPTVRDLADAPEDDVLALWSGLGYYARARNLHRAARQIRDQYQGKFPRDAQAIGALPGIGRSTAGAVAVFAYGARMPILDGNVKRVLTRFFGVEGFPGNREIEARLWAGAESLLPGKHIERYTQGLMDLGATLCKRGKALCDICPLAEDCFARRMERVADLPTPGPKKRRPEKFTVMLVVRRHDEVWLEKRPANGIWGGLWGFPEIQNIENAGHEIRRCLGHRAKVDKVLAPLRHGFTHFELHITPVLASIPGRGARKQPLSGFWVPVVEALSGAIPAPVRTLLLALS